MPKASKLGDGGTGVAVKGWYIRLANQAANFGAADDCGMNFKAGSYNIDLAAHLAECDANYMRVMQLFPQLREHDAGAVGVNLAGRRIMVSIEVAKRSRYTTVIRLRQSPEAPWGASPMFRVCLYHDLNCAEVTEYQSARQFNAVYSYPNAHMRQRDEKAQVNRLLGEFLSCCLGQDAVVHKPALMS